MFHCSVHVRDTRALSLIFYPAVYGSFVFASVRLQWYRNGTIFQVTSVFLLSLHIHFNESITLIYLIAFSLAVTWIVNNYICDLPTAIQRLPSSILSQIIRPRCWSWRICAADADFTEHGEFLFSRNQVCKYRPVTGVSQVIVAVPNSPASIKPSIPKFLHN